MNNITMGQVAVFDWAQVKLAEEYLRFLLKTEIPKQHIVSQLANAGGVNVIWDDNGSTKLEGSWEHIMKAQVVFENYIRSRSEFDAEECGNKTELHPEQIRILNSDEMKNNLSSKITPMNDHGMEENEVYVNITLSSTEISRLHQEPSQMTNNLQKNNCNVEKLSVGPSNIHEYKISSFEESFLSKSKPGQLINHCKAKENTYIPGCQPEVFYNISVQSCNEGKSNDKAEPSSKHNSFDTNQHEVKIDSVPHKSIIDDKEVTSGVVTQVESNLGENMIEHSNLGCTEKSDNLEHESLSKVLPSDRESKMVRPKYPKKKDYEELAPFKFFCSLCSFKSKRESHFQRHSKLHNEISELFKCSHCNFTSIRLSHLRRHELNHSNLTLTCNVCQYRTNNQKLLIRHKRIKHNTTKGTEVQSEILQCIHCEYQTSRYYFLQRHMRVHVTDASTVQVYHCEQCSYKTNRKEHFVRHTNNIHKGQRPFLCHRCGKAFKRQDALKQHSAIHLTQAAVSCPECGKGCRSQAHLSQHMSVHSSERSFLCELCGASFKTRAVQRKHMFTIHQHPKAFFCSHCSRKFSTKFALRRHIKQHSLLSSAEKKSKPQDQPTTTTTFVSESSGSMRLVAMDTILLSEPSRAHSSEQTVALADSTQQGGKITLQLTESYETEGLHVIPAQTVMQPNNEATTVVYLAGAFTPL